MSNASAWMPLYIGDYLGDTQRLTTEQHGAYFLLILDYWRNGPPPDSEELLRQITKLDKQAWRKHRPVLSRMFEIKDGLWHHKRVEKEKRLAVDHARRRSEKARLAAEARWAGQSSEHTTSNAPSNAPGIPQAMHGECPPPSPSPEEEDPSRKNNVTPLDRGKKGAA